MSELYTPHDPHPEDQDDISRLLASQRIAVRGGFTEQLMAALPEASWAKHGSRVWVVAAAVAVGLMIASSWLLASSPQSSSVVGSLAAVGDLVVTTLVAGAGLMSVSWGGIRTVFSEAFENSPVTLIVFGVFVVALNGLLFRLLRRRAVVALDKGRKSR